MAVSSQKGFFMHICLIIDNPETSHHPVLQTMLHKLEAHHHIALHNVYAEKTIPQADLYLLKSHASEALAIAYQLEQRGAMVVNSHSSAEACRDRVLMAQRLETAGLPQPRTLVFPTLAHALLPQEPLPELPWIIKSRYSYRGDLVIKLQAYEELQDLFIHWGEEPVILQEFAAGDGWDIKLWVIDGQIFAARRRSPLQTNVSKEDIPTTSKALPDHWTAIAQQVGQAFGLHLYGVDLIETEHGALIVDVNAFPGFRGVPGADDALVALVEKYTCSMAHEERKNAAHQPGYTH